MNGKCDHASGVFFEFVEAIHSREIKEGVLDKDSFNNEIGNGIRHEFTCNKCGKFVRWTPGGKIPKWLEDLMIKAYNPNARF